MASPVKCPACGAYSATRHCASPTCDLIRCPACREHGLPNGRLWSGGPLEETPDAE